MNHANSLLGIPKTQPLIKSAKVVLVVWINYPYRVVYVRFIGTHEQYDAIDAQVI